MPAPTPESKLFLIGILGVFALLMASLSYAVWESGRYYQPDRIEQSVELQNAE